MLVSFVPGSQNDLASMRLVLLNAGIMNHSNIIPDVKAEQRSTLASSLKKFKCLMKPPINFHDIFRTLVTIKS